MSPGRKSLLDAAIGALLGAAIPAGLFLARAHSAIYLCLALSSVLLMAGFGAILGHMEDRVRSLSLTDALTGLGNRRHFDRSLKQEIARSRRDGSPLSLLIIDVDHFKTVNDTYGHPAGDRVLRNLAGVLRAACRETDVLCRYGGDEIAVIAPYTVLSAAQLLAERARGQVSATAMQAAGPSLTITVSIGTASWSAADGGQDDLELVQRADQCLYQAKKARDQTAAAAPSAGQIRHVLPGFVSRWIRRILTR